MTIAAIAIILAAASLVVSFSPRPSATTVTPVKRTVWMATLEPAGTANVRAEPFPDPVPIDAEVPKAISKGMRLDPPDAQGNWRSVVYRLDPGTIIVNKGDEVTLKILGVNGRNHTITVEAYADTFFMKRGELKTVTFKADKAGIFEIWCSTHPPNMRANLIVRETP
ncbi:MAG: hypothetical protein HYU02_03685 [Thaumarchaeota archaeon]|nr:hypothetical protein [Nitrososphaerota archaeon]